MKKRNIIVSRRVIACIVAAALSMSMVGCGNGSNSGNTNTATEVSKAVTEQSNEKESSESSEITVVDEDETEVNNYLPSTEVADTALDEMIETETEEDDGLTTTQRNSINMLNYMTVLTQEVNESSGNQLFLESAYSSLVNDIYPNAVDVKTQSQITSLMDTIESYRMISVKRERLEYIYEQNRAQAMRQAIPNPVGLLSAVQSGSLLKASAAVIYMAVDSASSYAAATSQADMQFIQDGWELDDAEKEQLHNSTKTALTYMFNMVRDNSLPGDYALNQESVEDFVTWSENSNMVRAIAWLETNEGTYDHFGSYWLELAEKYYSAEDYKNCLKAVSRYENIATRIFRKDIDYATVLPMAIISAKETMDKAEYINTAEKYCDLIISNTKDSDWSLRYFAAQIYLDLCVMTDETQYLTKAYDIAFNNVNVLVDEQKSLNTAYLTDIKKAEADKDATKREKKEVKQYNKLLKDQRKVELPPVNEALYLNCDLLFALAEQVDISDEERKKVDSILHGNGEPLFLTTALDERFWFDYSGETSQDKDIAVEFDGDSLTLPAVCVSDRSTIQAIIKGADGETVVDDWTVSEVERPKKAEYTDFLAEYKSKIADKYKYRDGDRITISIKSVEESPDDTMEFSFEAVEKKKLIVFDEIVFEQVVE